MEVLTQELHLNLRQFLNEYADNFSKYNGFIDCSETSREPSEIIDIEEYETLADAEQTVDNKVYVVIDDENVEITYKYIAGSEITYFKYVIYEGNEYAIDDNSNCI